MGTIPRNPTIRRGQTLSPNTGTSRERTTDYTSMHSTVSQSAQSTNYPTPQRMDSGSLHLNNKYERKYYRTGSRLSHQSSQSSQSSQFSQGAFSRASNLDSRASSLYDILSSPSSSEKSYYTDLIADSHVPLTLPSTKYSHNVLPREDAAKSMSSFMLEHADILDNDTSKSWGTSSCRALHDLSTWTADSAESTSKGIKHWWKNKEQRHINAINLTKDISADEGLFSKAMLDVGIIEPHENLTPELITSSRDDVKEKLIWAFENNPVMANSAKKLVSGQIPETQQHEVRKALLSVVKDIPLDVIRKAPDLSVNFDKVKLTDSNLDLDTKFDETQPLTSEQEALKDAIDNEKAEIAEKKAFLYDFKANAAQTVKEGIRGEAPKFQEDYTAKELEKNIKKGKGINFTSPHTVAVVNVGTNGQLIVDHVHHKGNNTQRLQQIISLLGIEPHELEGISTNAVIGLKHRDTEKLENEVLRPIQEHMNNCEMSLVTNIIQGGTKSVPKAARPCLELLQNAPTHEFVSDDPKLQKLLNDKMKANKELKIRLSAIQLLKGRAEAVDPQEMAKALGMSFAIGTGGDLGLVQHGIKPYCGKAFATAGTAGVMGASEYLDAALNEFPVQNAEAKLHGMDLGSKMDVYGTTHPSLWERLRTRLPGTSKPSAGRLGEASLDYKQNVIKGTIGAGLGNFPLSYLEKADFAQKATGKAFSSLAGAGWLAGQSSALSPLLYINQQREEKTEQYLKSICEDKVKLPKKIKDEIAKHTDSKKQESIRRKYAEKLALRDMRLNPALSATAKTVLSGPVACAGLSMAQPGLAAVPGLSEVVNTVLIAPSENIIRPILLFANDNPSFKKALHEMEDTTLGSLAETITPEEAQKRFAAIEKGSKFTNAAFGWSSSSKSPMHYAAKFVDHPIDSTLKPVASSVAKGARTVAGWGSQAYTRIAQSLSHDLPSPTTPQELAHDFVQVAEEVGRASLRSVH